MARLLDRVRAEIQKNTLFDRTLTRIRAIDRIKKNLFGRALARIRAIDRDKTPLLVGLWILG